MARTFLALAVCLLCIVSEITAFEARITKPIDCDRNDVRFQRGHQYLYHYSTTTETSFVGTTASKSAFRLDCDVVVEARRKCEAYLNVTLCSLYHRQPGDGDVYTKDTTLSADITNLLSRELYFQSHQGNIRPHTIVVDSEETNDVLNIKRGILSALQIKILSEEPGDQKHTMETVDLLGTCPTEYVVESPGKVLTFRDITRCQVPHYSYRQHNMFSMIKKVYGGFLNSPIDELIYPFNSTIECEHTLGDKHRLEETKCLQQQVFRPFAREGTVVATCMTNISQHLILQETRDLLESNVNRKMRGKKSGSLGYGFDDRGESILVTKDDISHWLHKLTTYDGTIETTPKLFHEFLWFLRQAQTNDILEVLADVWNCHGNQGNYCNRKLQTLEQDYLHDGLLACGTDACISAFTQTMRAGHISRWMEYMFVYDIALYHESSSEVASTMLEMCIERDRESCWFPLSIMINKIATAGKIATDLESGPVYRTLHHVRETIGDTCQNGIPSTFTQTEKQNAIDELLQMIKVLGNIGSPVQYVYDSKYAGMEGQPEDRRLVRALLQCASNIDLPNMVTKSAVLALHKMTITYEMKDSLLGIFADVNRSPSLRSSIFARLVIEPDRYIASELNDLIYAETMKSMKGYMVTYIKSLLQNDQPDLKPLRDIWEELMNEDSRQFPYYSHRFGISKYVEMSRYIKFPLQIDFHGFQVELDTVYNLRSPVVNAVVLRVNYFTGHKVNLLELAMDIDDFHVIWDSIKTFPLPRPHDTFGYHRDNTVFDTLQKNIVTAILELFDKINLSQENIPDGIVHVKILDQEIFYLDLRDLMTILLKNPQQSIYNVDMGKLQMILEQLPIYKTSSTSLVDIISILPSVGGFPINMTVSVAMSVGLEFDATLTMPDIINLNTDVQLDASLKTHTAVHCNGELVTRFGQHSLSGARGSSTGMAQMSVSPSLRINTQPEQPKVLDFSLSQANTDSLYTIANLSGHIYLMHSSGEEEIEGDPEFQTTEQDCDEGMVYLITGNQVCFTSVYPNTTSSTRHAYFPLSGPFHYSLDTRKVETDTLRLSVVRIREKDHHFWINLTREGQESTVGMSIHYYKTLYLYLVELMIPESQIHLYAHYEYGRHYDVNSTTYNIYDVHLTVAGTTLNRFLAKERSESILIQERPSVRTKRKIVDVIMAIPGASLAVTVNSFRNKSRGHYNTVINMTYHCVKARPLLYLLHWNPTLAEQNGDVTVGEVVNDAVIGYTSNKRIWTANDYMQLKLPGLKISLDNKMEANVTNAKRQTVIVYTGIDGQEETVTMNAHVHNSTNSTYITYDYFMMLTHSGMPYHLSLRGHMKGIIDNLNIVTEIEPVSKSFRESSEVGDGSMEVPEDGTCVEALGRTLVTLNVERVTVPDGIETRWNYNYSRQGCGGQDQYCVSGLYGQQGVNNRWNFHYWSTVDVTVHESRDAVGQQEPVVRSKSYSGSFRAHMKHFPIHFMLSYSSQLVNTSYVWRAMEEYRTKTLLLQSQLQTPWPVVNFNIKNIYVWSRANLTHTTEVTSAWLDVDTVIHYNITWLDILSAELHSRLDSRLPWLPGVTNVTGRYEMSDDVLPQLLLTLERSDGILEIKADMVNTTFNIITLSFRKPGEEAVHVLTWQMALSSMRASTHTLDWNPDLVQVVTEDSSGRISWLQLALVQVGEAALDNANKPVLLMVIPFTDMTLGVFLETYLYPYLRFPVTNSGFGTSSIGGNSESAQEETRVEVAGNLLAKSLSRTMGSTLTVFGEMSARPPWIVRRLVDILIRPSVEQILAESRVSFTVPLLGLWRSFLLHPRESYGLRYLEGVYGRLTKSIHTHIETTRGFVVQRQYLVTYYYRVYHIPDDQAADCVHLLAGDFERETFAVLLSRQGITVVTSEMTVTMEFGGNVFRDNCPRPLRLPFGRKGSRIHVYMEREELILTTTYGVQVSCDNRRNVCRIDVMKKHFSNSWGLLGTNDGEPGSDFQLPNKYITSSVNAFIQSYAVGGPPRCVYPEYQHDTGVDESLYSNSPANTQTPCSPEMVDECNRQFEGAAQSSCYSQIPYQMYLEQCLSEARSCGLVAFDACKHILAYEYVCHLQVSYYSIAVDCNDNKSENDDGSRRPVDIVVVVSDELESSRSDIEVHMENLLNIIKNDIRNVQVGIVGYGGETQIIDALDPTASTRYMVSLDTLDISAAYSPWRGAWKRFPGVVSMNDALDMAASYPYRMNTQRVVIVISRENPNITDAVKTKYENLNIIVNSFGDYKTVGPSYKVNGINWDNTVIYRDWLSSYRIMPLPEGSLVELVVASKGAVFNADSVTERRKKRLRFIIKHIKENISLNNFC